MTASRNGLAFLLALAIAFALVAFAGGGAPGVEDRALVPGLDVEHVGRLAWLREGQPALDLVRRGDRWQWSGGWAEPGAVDRVLTGLRGGRWHREADEARAGAIRATLVVDGAFAGEQTSESGARAMIAIGQPLPGGDQTWVVVDHRAFLVDAWLARALDPAPLELRVKRPLADAPSAATVQLARGELALSIDVPHQTLSDGTTTLHLDPDVQATTLRALAELDIVRLPDSPLAAGAPGAGLRVTLRQASSPPVVVELAGACPGAPDLVAIRATSGDGCVDRAAAAELERVAGRLGGAPDALVDRRPAPDAVKVTLLDGGVIDASKRPMIDGAAADPAKVADLLAALAEPGFAVLLAPVAVPVTAPPSAAPPAKRLAVTTRSGASVMIEVRGDLLVVDDSPVALRPTPARLAILVAPSATFRSPVLWVEEPTTITTIATPAATWHRGAVLGEWTRGPAPAAVDAKTAALLETLAAALASPRVEPGPSPAAPAVARHLSFTVAPPVGDPTRHDLDVGLAGDTCTVVDAHDTTRILRVSRTLCDALAPL